MEDSNTFFALLDIFNRVKQCEVAHFLRQGKTLLDSLNA